MDLLEDLQQNTSSVTIDALWSNGFVPGPRDQMQELIKIYSKGKIVGGAQALNVPVNKPFTRMIAAPEAGAARVSMDDQMTVTVLSPRVQWLREFADLWIDSWRSQITKGKKPELLAFLNDYDIIETFADQKIELLPSPIEPPKIENTNQQRLTENSSVNLGSIVLMLELHGKRILLTGDSREDVIISGLAQAGYTDNRGNAEVDVLVVPHGGSDRNISVNFFQRVKARHYVLSANGTHKNPELRTFAMLFEARRGDTSSFSIGLSYHPEEYVATKDKDRNDVPYPIQELCTLLNREKNAGTQFEIITPKKDQSSFGIDLWSDAGFVDKGNKNAVCN